MRRLPLRSPPRMRGKDFLIQHCLFSQGITPAYAGKSFGSFCFLSFRQDHPRVCGEKQAAVALPQPVLGSPPRMRGKVFIGQVCIAPKGITPAYAGKRDILNFTHDFTGDHPRVCGEKYMGVPTKVKKPGSPPRVRGKGQAACEVVVEFGITPACAGKSCSSSVSSSQRMSWTIRSRI